MPRGVRPYPTPSRVRLEPDIRTVSASSGFITVGPASNARFHHAEACWDATYQSNSYGARDAERTRYSSSRRRYVVLGDSFIEGYAIQDGERLTDRLNTSPEQEFLNFGTSGAFGTVQELVLYRTLASSFEHSDVLLFVLPVNDFSDSDPQYFARSRYRPYLRRTDHGDELHYTVAFDDRDNGTLGWSMLAWNWLSELGIMAEAIRQLRVAAGTRPVHVFLIPVSDDVAGYHQGVRYALPGQLRSRMGDATNVDVTDLLPAFVEYADAHHVPAAAFHLPCDAHWSPLGNAVAADAVTRHLRFARYRQEGRS